MARKKSTDIKLSEIKKDHKQYSVTEQFEFEDGKTLTFHPYFQPSEIEKLIGEMQEKLIEADKLKISFNEKMMHDYALFLVIKHFTHLGKDISDDLTTQLDEMEWIVDHKYFKPIIEEAFLPQEIMKVWDKMTDILSRSQLFEKMGEETQKKFQSLEIKNRDVFEKLANMKVDNGKQIPEA